MLAATPWIALAGTALAEPAHRPHFRGSGITEEEQSMRDAESLTHLAYGEIIKRFHLGTAHVFHSWDQLNEDDRARWLAVFTEVRKTLAREEGGRISAGETTHGRPRPSWMH